jgi:hypothetical protein
MICASQPWLSQLNHSSHDAGARSDARTNSNSRSPGFGWRGGACGAFQSKSSSGMVGNTHYRPLAIVLAAVLVASALFAHAAFPRYELHVVGNRCESAG